MRRFAIAFAVLLLSPFAAHAAFSFTEIMYDAAGTDAKHEWVEIQNDGSAVDMSGYKFFENGSNHGLTLVAGSATVGAGGYAVISDDAATFLVDYPSFSGTLFDSAFSLSNTGESLTLRDETLTDIASASYTGELGASGDGNSLNFLSSSWFPRLPTPGLGAASGSAEPPPPSTTNNSSSDSGTTQSTGSSVAITSDEPRISVQAGDDRSVVVGAGTVFSAKALGTKGEPLVNARYVWNFGNAATKEGQSVMYAYTIPGAYTVTVDVSSAGYGATDRLTVTAVAADIVVTRANAEFVELHNRTNRELDLGLWQLAAGGVLFVLPPHTLIGSNKAIAMPKEVTGLAPASPAEVTLYYPNGTKAATVAPEVAFVAQASAPQVAAQAPTKKTTSKSVAKREPRKLVASTTLAERGTLVANSIDATSRDFAWFSFGLLASIIVFGLGALVYLGRQ